MEVKWTSKSLADLARFHQVLAHVDRAAAARAVQALASSPRRLLANPRIGQRLDEFDPREVRRLLIGDYEIRYEITATTLYVLRLWHTREDR